MSYYFLNNAFALYKKWSFPLRIPPVNVTKSAVSFRKLLFLCSVAKKRLISHQWFCCRVQANLISTRKKRRQCFLLHLASPNLQCYRSSHPKDVLKICSTFTAEQPCWSAISIKLLCNFVEITLRQGFSCKFAAVFKNTFSSEQLWRAASGC